MKSLYLRIYLTVVAVLLLFALASGWIVKRNIEHERAEERVMLWSDRMSAWGELAQNNLPEATAPPEAQARALLDWATRLRLPLALNDAQGRRIAASPSPGVCQSWAKACHT